VLHHLAALDAQDVNDGDAAIVRRKSAMGMDRHQVAVGEDALDRIADVRVLREEGFQEPDRGVAP